MTRRQKIGAEFVGSAFLLTIIVGSGIMGEKLAAGNAALALLANSVATGCGLAVLIFILVPISGAQLNPLVTLLLVLRRELSWRLAAAFILAQSAGAFLGVALAHLMFDLPLFAYGDTPRTGIGQWTGEVVATVGLLVTIFTSIAYRPSILPLTVGAYIAGAYWFTSSTSFANPAVTLARAATDTFAGIRPEDVSGFIVSQLLGALLAYFLVGRRS